jgi:KUP system potassium uptake protein
MTDPGSRDNPRAGVGLMLSALGVVFGDIGTSPLYSIQTVFERSAREPVPLDQTSIYGVISVVFWSITIVVTLLYVQLLMRADNDGEGGLLSLLSLLQREDISARLLKVLFGLGIFGAALFFGDSLITPAISVLSAVEGLKVVDPGLGAYVVPGAVGILLALLVIQRWGTARVGRLFGPVMVTWFVAIALCGIPEIVRAPAVLQALSPIWAVRYFAAHPFAAFISLGGVVLVVTGAEALYADLGHFGRTPIVRSWMALVFPALTLNYLGQGALLLRQPSDARSPFFLLVPHWALFPMVALATAATVIASQAVISGAFSVAHQADRLGYLPHLRVRHTSSTSEGQIYIPVVNAVLLVGVLGLVLGYQSSGRLAAAYGLAVSGTITISAALFFVLRWASGAWPRWRVAAAAGFFITVPAVFLAANTLKIPEGGWLPVGIGVVFFLLLTTWRRGGQLAEASRDKVEGDLQAFIDELHGRDVGVQRVPGCVVFLTRGEGKTPLAMRANIDHNHTLHESTVLLTLSIASVPRVSAGDRVTVSNLGFSDDGISHATARVGYLDRIDIPDLLLEAVDKGLEGSPDAIDGASYFFSVPELRITDAPGMTRWRKHLYLAMTRLAPDPVESFALPRTRTVVMGAEIEI